MYYIAAAELLACWFAWAYPFIMRAPHAQRRESFTIATPTRIGLALQGTAIFMAWILRIPPSEELETIRYIGSMALGPVAAGLAWNSVKHLGRQFRMHAGLYADHTLVRTGAYRIVRHPIYASILALHLSTLLLMTPWKWIFPALALFLAGTEIRVRSEDRLLASRFGEEFQAYRAGVPAYIPLVR